MSKRISPSSDTLAAVGIHLLVSLYVLASPVLLMGPSDSITLTEYLQRIVSPLFMCVIFYTNFFILVPRLFLQKRHWQFFVLNVALLLLIAWMQNLYFDFLCNYWLNHGDEERRAFARHMLRRHEETGAVALFCKRYAHTMLSHLIVVVIALSARISLQWNKAEKARQQAEIGLREAELQNLRNQINPHFLLNTLNNIYALTVFDTEKAQKAIQELGKMLRYILYENQTQFVSLQKEAEFIRNYVALMRLRLPQSVEVSVSISFPEQDNLQVAPLIFIPLVENAFKHGISPTQPSFIRISLTANDGNIHFTETNSNFPKTKSDKTPGGIGLQQVRKRLELSYPGSHAWHYGTTPDGSTYFSTIEICLTRE